MLQLLPADDWKWAIEWNNRGADRVLRAPGSEAELIGRRLLGFVFICEFGELDGLEFGLAGDSAEFALELHLGEGVGDGEAVGHRGPFSIVENVLLGTFFADAQAGA